MQKRIDSAVTSSSPADKDSGFSEETLTFTKILVTEDKLLSVAMERNQFYLYYQPIVDLTDNRIVGCEALVRWNHPSGKLYPPSRFIAQAEKSGLIVELGYWIAEEACSFQSRLINDLNQDLFVSVNLSGKQFEDPNLIPRLADIMTRSGTSQERMKFEITESLLMDNPELAAQALNQLKKTGVKLAIDDFGTGYSSFSYLHRFPFDTLKIDRVFINAMTRSRKSDQIVKSLVNLSHDLGMDVIAEGIESEQQVESMRNYKTGFGQGFFFSRPVNETAFVKLLLRPQT
jgi:EAL domain-containing protein (putative c-di-GMP-specific phosphodiesterase class I)